MKDRTPVREGRREQRQSDQSRGETRTGGPATQGCEVFLRGWEGVRPGGAQHPLHLAAVQHPWDFLGKGGPGGPEHDTEGRTACGLVPHDCLAHKHSHTSRFHHAHHASTADCIQTPSSKCPSLAPCALLRGSDNYFSSCSIFSLVTFSPAPCEDI